MLTYQHLTTRSQAFSSLNELTEYVSAPQVWTSNKGHEVASLPSTSPLNCVTFDPEGHLLAVGCWNGKVIVWNWLQNKTLAVSFHDGRMVNG